MTSVKVGRPFRRPLLSELGPWGYQVAYWRKIVQRQLTDALHPHIRLARGLEPAISLPIKVKAHRSLIMRRLGNVDMTLQEGKARSLAITAPLVDGIIIHPGETFSFWSLVGRPTARRGFDVGVTVTNGRAVPGIGGGLCQFSNLLHWMALHSPLTIVEHHHHNEFDLFPDFRRQIPFGTGTSVFYNYGDYRLRNDSDQDFQIRMRVDGEYLCGELLTTRPLALSYKVRETDAYFYESLRSDGIVEVRRHNRIERRTIDKRTGNVVLVEQLLENDARTMYDRSLISSDIRPLGDGGGSAASPGGAPQPQPRAR